MKSMPVLIAVAAVMAFGLSTPAWAGSDGHSKDWSVPIGTQTGTLEITEGTDMAELEAMAISQDELNVDFDKAWLGKAVNDDERYFLVWVLKSYDSDSGAKTVHVLDGGTGEQLVEPRVMEGGSCSKSKSRSNA